MFITSRGVHVEDEFHDDEREEILRWSHARRRLEKKCQGAPICGCPVCCPEDYQPEEETNEDCND